MDGTYKLEIHILNFNNGDYNKLEIYKGDKIKLIGNIRNKSKHTICNYLSKKAC